MYNFGYNSGNTPKKTPTEVSKVCAQFLHSSIIIIAIIAYTIYAGISAISGLDVLSQLDNTFELMEISFFIGLGVLLIQLLVFQPIIVTVGLWQMFNSDGKWGANTVRAGISAFVGGASGGLGCILAGIMIESGPEVVLSVLFEDLLFPIIFIIFATVAISSLRDFAESVECTAHSGEAYTDGVVKAGTLMAIFLGLTLIIIMNIMESIEDSPLAYMLKMLPDDSLLDVSIVTRFGALTLFCISAFVFNNKILQAREKDRSAAAATVTGPVWQCSCGRVNRDYVTTCICGVPKRTMTAPNTENAATPETQPMATQPITQPTATQPEDAPSAEESTNENAKQSDTPTTHIFCSECGYKCSAQAKFCKSCGSKLI